MQQELIRSKLFDMNSVNRLKWRHMIINNDDYCPMIIKAWRSYV